MTDKSTSPATSEQGACDESRPRCDEAAWPPSGRPVPPGVYLHRLETEGRALDGRSLLLR